MTERLTPKRVHASIAKRAPKPTRLMQIVREFGLPRARRDEVRDVLEQLMQRGVIEQVSGHRFQLCEPGTRAGEPSVDVPARARARAPAGRGESHGWVWLHPRGFGFVTTDDGGPDVFVPGSKLYTAMHGDFVRIRSWASERGREGRVQDVLERGVHRIAGRFMRQHHRAWIEPEDIRLPQPIEVVGSVPLGIEAGDDVIALIDAYPRRIGEGLRVRVLGALAPRGTAASEIERIELREGVQEEFGRAALAEAQGFGTRVPRAEIQAREDLRDLALVTIDPSDARDHDDAVFGERLPSGAFRLVIAIADVSHYVREGSALDRAAAARGTSIYLPDRVIPMLPFELSSNLASLVPNETRLALALDIELGPRGAVRKHRYVEAVVKSHARLTYEGVAHALGLSDAFAAQPEAQRRRALLETLWEASQVLRSKRRARGSLEFELPEPVVVLDEDHEPRDVVRARSDPGLRQAYGMIEDLMLLANEVVATDLSRRGLPTIYRIHPPPDAERVLRFAELATSLGHAVDADAGEHPHKLAQLLRDVEGTEHAAALNFLLLRAMQQATYDTLNVGHFALAAASYLHFTSPIRRYPDLAVHRVVRAVIHKRRVDIDALSAVLKTQAANSSRLERRAQAIDREVARLYGALVLRDRIGETLDAQISSLDSAGLWLTLSSPYVEVRCPVERLGREGFALDALGLRLRARRSGHSYGLGDLVRVVIDGISIEERTVTVHIEGTEPSSHEDASRRDAGPRRARSRRERPGRDAESGRGERVRGKQGKRDKRRIARKGERRKESRGKRGRKR